MSVDKEKIRITINTPSSGHTGALPDDITSTSRVVADPPVPAGSFSKPKRGLKTKIKEANIKGVGIGATQRQLKNFNAEMGKKIALLVVAILSLLLTGNVVPGEFVLQFYIMGSLFVNMLILGFIVQAILKKFKKMNDDHTKSIESMTDRFDTVEKNMGGRIRILENFNPYAVWEMDNASGLLISVNEQFYEITGYKKSEMNDILRTYSPDIRPIVFMDILVVHEDRQAVKVMYDEIMAGNKNYGEHYFYFKRKYNGSYPVMINFNLVSNNGYTIIHGLIQDVSAKRDMEETIKMQEDLLEGVIELFTRKQTEREMGEYIFDVYIPKLRQEINKQMNKKSD